LASQKFWSGYDTDDAMFLMMLCSWWCYVLDDAMFLMMLCSWWCYVLDDAMFLMMLCSWWCYVLDDAMFLSANTKLKYTLPAQRRLIKRIEQNLLQRHWRLNHRVTDTCLTERFATALENHRATDTFLTLLFA